MKKKIYHLSSCSTCVRIIKELSPEGDPLENGFELQNIKTEPITAAQLQEMRDKAGSYEALFSRRALKYKAMGLKDKNLQEDDYRKLILEEYTFLKRPVMLFGDEIFVGNSKKVVEAAKAALEVLTTKKEFPA